MRHEEKLFRLFGSLSEYPEILVRVLMDRGAFDDQFLKDIEDMEIPTFLPDFNNIGDVRDYCERLLEGRPTAHTLLKKALDREDYHTAARLRDRIIRGDE